MAPQKKSVSQLPLFSDWHAVSTKNTHIGATPVLTLRLRSLGGGNSVSSAALNSCGQGNVTSLASWESLSDSMKQSDVAHPPRRH